MAMAHDSPPGDGHTQVHFGNSAFHASSISMPSPFDSQVHLPSEGGQDFDDDYLEKQPLNDGQNFASGFYPPPYVYQNSLV